MTKRSFFEEISELENTWELMSSNPPEVSPKISTSIFKGNAICVGSGGSLSLAKAWQLMHEKRELGFAKALTPYEFLNLDNQADIVVLFSAIGNNHDIIQVFKSALNKGCRILVVTNSRNSKLIRLSKTYKNESFAIYPRIDISKDGFLAVTSIVSMYFLIYYLSLHLFNEDFDDFSPVKLAFSDHLNFNKDKHVGFFSTNTTQIIASEWGVPAGIDFESRLAESGIGNCFLTDPRNFSHGRFLWLEKYQNKSQIVLFSTGQSYKFIKRFLNIIPSNIPCLWVYSSVSGLFGSLYCSVRSILLLGEFAKKKRIDPGLPHVPQWGKKLHNLYYDTNKVTFFKNNKENNNYPALQQTFSSLILDYDGTLVDTCRRFEPIKNEIIDELIRLLRDGLRLGIATGRGYSAFDSLKNQIPNFLHKNIIVGLYNGTIIKKLSSKTKYSTKQLKIIKLIANLLKNKPNNQIIISIKPSNISLRGGNEIDRLSLINHIKSKMGKFFRFIRVKSSGHSIDIFPYWGSKLSVVFEMIDSFEKDILCIGDQGQVGGNDEDILSWIPSISVGKDQPASNFCYWIGKDSLFRESLGTYKILRSINKHSNSFFIDTNKF